jgi:agmatine/peptidylarginine deiminase
MLHVERVLWLDHGNLIGDDTDGHVDTVARLAPNDTIVYMQCQDKDDEQYADLHAMEEQIRELRTADGNPYRMLALPSPAPIHDEDGERLPATYANFLIMNSTVLYPTYAQPDNDRLAAEVLSKAFPGYEIVGIDCRALIKQHGSLHCVTMQYPKNERY